MQNNVQINVELDEKTKQEIKATVMEAIQEAAPTKAVKGHSLTFSDVARLLGVSVNTVRAMHKRGEFPAYHAGTRLLVSPQVAYMKWGVINE